MPLFIFYLMTDGADSFETETAAIYFKNITLRIRIIIKIITSTIIAELFSVVFFTRWVLQSIGTCHKI
jgi:hypothetical protein